MPEAERGWVAEVRAAAVKAGWKYKLWDWEELLGEFGAEPVAEVFRRAFALPGEVISPAVVSSLASDYYRSRVLADDGGVYLDTDFECRSGWPDFEGLLAAAGVDVMVLEEFFKPVPCAGFFACADGWPMRLAVEAAAEQLLRVLPPNAADFATRLVAECRRDVPGGGLAQRGVGPGWRRRVVLPLWQAEGVHWAFVPRTAVGHRQWREAAALVHMGAARWHEQSGTALAALWQARALAARQAEFNAALPVWLRPQGTRLLPKTLPRRRLVQPPTQTLLDGLTLPRGVCRVVVFSNVPGLDAQAVLKPGDLAVHINRARQFPAARLVAGVTHALVVRRGKDRAGGGPIWFDPPSTAGFSQVLHVQDVPMRARRRWWQEYCRANPGKCPTTGFICWHLAREAAPGVPVVLVGFDPSRDCGTYRWPGHAWGYEAAEYARKQLKEKK